MYQTLLIYPVKLLHCNLFGLIYVLNFQTIWLTYVEYWSFVYPHEKVISKQPCKS